MIPQRKSSATLGLTLLAVMATATTVQGGVLGLHSQVIARTENGTGPFVWLESDGPADTGVVYGADNGDWDILAGGQAYTSLGSQGFLHAGAQAYSNAPGAYSAAAEASAAWRDVAYLSGPDGPVFLTLHLQVEAHFEGAGWAFGNSLKLESSGTYVSGLPWRTLSTAADARYVGPGSGVASVVAGFDEWTMTDGLFRGTIHIDTPFDASLGGYYWEARLTVQAGAVRTLHENETAYTYASVDALHSVGLVAVTDPDGNSVAVTFDSGLNSSVVPEPGAISLFSIGVAVLGICRCRRRGRRP